MGDGEKASLRLQFNPQIRLELHGATITSDAGLLAFRELDDALDLTPIASDYLQESRTGRNIRHHLVPLLRPPPSSRIPVRSRRGWFQPFVASSVPLPIGVPESANSVFHVPGE